MPWLDADVDVRVADTEATQLQGHYEVGVGDGLGGRQRRI